MTGLLDRGHYEFIHSNYPEKKTKRTKDTTTTAATEH